MLSIKHIFSKPPGSLFKTNKTNSRLDRAEPIWRRIAGSSLHRFTGPSFVRHSSSRPNLIGNLFEKAPFMDSRQLAELVRQETDYPLRALIERVPQLQSRSFRDFYGVYGYSRRLFLEPKENILREAMDNLDELFVAKVRKKALEIIQKDAGNTKSGTGNTKDEASQEEEWKEANQVRSVLQCSEFADKYPNSVFTMAYQQCAKVCRLEEKSSLDTIEYLKGFYSHYPVLNHRTKPHRLWLRYKAFVREGKNNGMAAQYEEGVKHVLFNVLPLVLDPSGALDKDLAINQVELTAWGDALNAGRRTGYWRATLDFDPPSFFLGLAHEQALKSDKTGVENVDYVQFGELTQIGGLLEQFELAFANEVLNDPRLECPRYNWREDQAKYAANRVRSLAEWRKFDLEHQPTCHALVYREHAKLYGVDDDDFVEYWERLKLVASRVGVKEPLNTSVPQLMESYKARLSEYTESESMDEPTDSLGRRIARKQDWRSRVSARQLSSIDDEKQVEHFFTTVIPKMFEPHPVTGNTTLVKRPVI